VYDHLAVLGAEFDSHIGGVNLDACDALILSQLPDPGSFARYQ
jgi:hypothetical protein